MPDVTIPAEMLKLAEHILDTKAADFDPSKFENHYEVALVNMLEKKQAGAAVSKTAPKVAAQQTGDVINLLKRSIAIGKKGGKTKSPSIAPSMPKAKAKPRQWA